MVNKTCSPPQTKTNLKKKEIRLDCPLHSFPSAPNIDFVPTSDSTWSKKQVNSHLAHLTMAFFLVDVSNFSLFLQKNKISHKKASWL
jgi:hypothetical protein